MKLVSKHIASLLLTTMALSPAAVVFAQEVSGGADAQVNVQMGPDGQHPRQEFRDERMKEREDFNEKQQGIRQDARGEINEIRAEGEATTTDGHARIKAIRQQAIQSLKTNRETFKTEMEARKAQLLTAVQNKKDAKKVKLEAKAQERVQKNVDHIFNDLTARVEHISSVDVKIAAKLNELSASTTVNVSSVTALYTSAQAALAKAKTDVAAAQAAATQAVASTTSKEALHTLVTTAQTSIKAAVENYLKVAEALRALLPKPEATVTATTTASTTVSQ